MIEKFTAEELAIIVEELTSTGRLPEKQDKRYCARTAINRIDNAIMKKYGGEQYSLDNAVHSAVLLFCDIITGNCHTTVRSARHGEYAVIQRHRQVITSPLEWQAIANKFADLFVELIDATPRVKTEEPAKENHSAAEAIAEFEQRLENARKGKANE